MSVPPNNLPTVASGVQGLPNYAAMGEYLTPAEQLDQLRTIRDGIEVHVLAPRTRYRYDGLWEDFTKFGARHALQTLPATHDTVTLYLTSYAMTHGVTSVRMAHSAIRRRHIDEGYPFDSQAASSFFMALARIAGRPPSQKSALLGEDIRQICAALDAKGGIEAVRDKALTLLGYGADLPP